MKPICEIIKNNLKEDIRIIDYGSGTGGSAIEIIKILHDNNIKNYKIYLIDPLIAWFSKAYFLLKDNPNVEFLICRKKINDKFKFLNISEMIKNKVDIIVCSNTIHLIKNKVVNNLLSDCKSVLNKEGLLLFNSGDINEDDNKNLNNFSRNLFNNIISSNNLNTELRIVNKIFPNNDTIKLFSNNNDYTIFTKNISISKEELYRFFKTPRLHDFCLNERNIDLLNKYIDLEYEKQKTFVWTYIIYKKK